MRSTAPGLLDDLGAPVRRRPPSGADAFGGALSVVVDARAGIRRLPTLFLERSELYADRDPARVADRLRTLVAAIRSAPQRATYAATRCSWRGRDGLYARDLYNRSTHRIGLARRGMSFAADPFVVLSPYGRFVAGGDAFVPAFIVLADDHPDDPGRVVRSGGAMVPFLLAGLRFGELVDGAELAALRRAVEGAVGLSSGDVGALARALDRTG